MSEFTQFLFVVSYPGIVVCLGTGHGFGFRNLSGKGGRFSQLVNEFEVLEHLLGVAVHVLFQLFEHGAGTVECKERVLLSQLVFFIDGGYFFGFVHIVDNAFFYIIFGQVFFFCTELFADTV